MLEPATSPRSRSRYSTNRATSRSTGSLTTAAATGGISPTARKYPSSCRADVGEHHCCPAPEARAVARNCSTNDDVSAPDSWSRMANQQLSSAINRSRAPIGAQL
ncbi:MAG TPA: hypothetical protein VK510_05070 [Solirubrobacteraceae bacterium]|nr:hypothetical protein [Solirubrobacteraceae bacterium]